MNTIDWQSWLLNNATIVFMAAGIVWRLGLKIKKTGEQVIEDNATLKAGMILVQTDVRAMQTKVEHLERNVIGSQNALIENIMKRLEKLEATK